MSVFRRIVLVVGLCAAVHASEETDALSTSDFAKLTNWLLTPFLSVNEGMTPLYAQQGIRGLGTNVLPALIALVRHQDTNLSRAAGMAVTGFAALGPAAAPAVGQLAECLSDPRSDVRVTAARCLSSIGESASNAAPALVGVLRDSAAEVSSLSKYSCVANLMNAVTLKRTVRPHHAL